MSIIINGKEWPNQIGTNIVQYYGDSNSGKVYYNGTNFIIGTKASTNLQLLPGAGGITQIGDAGTTSRGLITNDDLFVSGRLEVDGIAYLEGASTRIIGNMYAYNVAIFGYGGLGDSLILCSVLDDGYHIGVSNSTPGLNNNIIICKADYYFVNHDHSDASSDPTLIFHSLISPNANNQSFISLCCDKTNLAVQTACGSMSVYQLAEKATAYFTLTGIPTATETITIGAEVWTFVALRGAAWQITIGADAATTIDNMVVAINADSALVDAYDEGDVTDLYCCIRAAATGFAPNGTAFSDTATNMTSSATTMTGGQSAGGAFLREDFFDAAQVTNGGSAATLTAAGASTYYLLDAITEFVHFGTKIRDDWDGNSDIIVEIDVANELVETDNDLIRASLQADYYGNHDDMDTPKTQTISLDHDITTYETAGEIHRLFFRLNWDEAANVIEVNDNLKLKFWLDDITTGAVVAAVRFLSANIHYRSKYPRKPCNSELEATA